MGGFQSPGGSPQAKAAASTVCVIKYYALRAIRGWREMHPVRVFRCGGPPRGGRRWGCNQAEQDREEPVR
jgi:hypothetical protein